MRIKKQVVMITGCSSGIGRALAEEFAEEGHDVVATARKLDSIEDLGGRCIKTLELDVADIVDERVHAYAFPTPRAGFVDMRVLADPRESTRDDLDSGRRIPEGRTETFTLRSHLSAPSMRLIVRAAPTHAGRVEVTMDGRPIGDLALEPSEAWTETSLRLPAPLQPGQSARFTFTPRDVHGWVNYHVWLIATP